MTQQNIALSYDEQILVQLSIAQNGSAIITTAHDADGNRTGYVSQFPIDLTKYADALAAQKTSDLNAYANTKQNTLLNGGVSVNLATAGQPAKIVKATTDVSGRTNLSGLVALAQMSSDFTTVWVGDSGAITLSAAEVVSLGVAVGSFVQATYVTLAAVLAGIANGTIHTQGDIDAANWPFTSISAPPMTAAPTSSTTSNSTTTANSTTTSSGASS